MIPSSSSSPNSSPSSTVSVQVITIITSITKDIKFNIINHHNHHCHSHHRHHQCYVISDIATCPPSSSSFLFEWTWTIFSCHWTKCTHSLPCMVLSASHSLRFNEEINVTPLPWQPITISFHLKSPLSTLQQPKSTIRLFTWPVKLQINCNSECAVLHVSSIVVSGSKFNNPNTEVH